MIYKRELIESGRRVKPVRILLAGFIEAGDERGGARNARRVGRGRSPDPLHGDVAGGMTLTGVTMENDMWSTMCRL